MAFHEILFPTAIAFGSSGGPERRTEIVTLGSGYEERNAVWANSRQRYNAGYGVRHLADLHDVIAFFEARTGRLHGFRWRDKTDFNSRKPGQGVTATDQIIGTGDGVTTQFQLVKVYASGSETYSRTITKPVEGSLLVAVDGTPTTQFTVDTTTGIVTLGTPAGNGLTVTAGFLFDVPVRFDTDFLDINLTGFNAGQLPNIPIVEIRV